MHPGILLPLMEAPFHFREGVKRVNKGMGGARRWAARRGEASRARPARASRPRRPHRPQHACPAPYRDGMARSAARRGGSAFARHHGNGTGRRRRPPSCPRPARSPWRRSLPGDAKPTPPPFCSPGRVIGRLGAGLWWRERRGRRRLAPRPLSTQ